MRDRAFSCQTLKLFRYDSRREGFLSVLFPRTNAMVAASSILSDYYSNIQVKQANVIKKLP